MKRTSTLLSLVPTYFCNFRCPFCYLGKDNLADRTVIGHDAVLKILSEISAYRKIDAIEILGGEISTLDDALMESYIHACKSFTEGRVFLQSNLSRIPDYFLRDDIELSISYDYKCREQYETVYSNMKKLPRGFSVVMVATECLMKYPVDLLIAQLNDVPNITYIDIKPFSAFTFSKMKVSYKRFEAFLQEFIEKSHLLKGRLVNIDRIKMALENRMLSTFQDGHIYISPRGKIAVIEFDSSDREYYRELDSFDEYLAWQEKKKAAILQSPICGKCEFLGKCTTEHNRNVTSLDDSCDGWYNILKWYQGEHYAV